jgi:hypothetical protein
VVYLALFSQPLHNQQVGRSAAVGGEGSVCTLVPTIKSRKEVTAAALGEGGGGGSGEGSSRNRDKHSCTPCVVDKVSHILLPSQCLSLPLPGELG